MEYIKQPQKISEIIPQVMENMEKPKMEEQLQKSSKVSKEEVSNSNNTWYENNLKIWLESLFDKLYLARKIDEFERLNNFLKTLIELDFKEFNKKPAEHWILLGDWKYKKSNSLILADFIPTDEQLISIGKEFITLKNIMK